MSIYEYYNIIVQYIYKLFKIIIYKTKYKTLSKKIWNLQTKANFPISRQSNFQTWKKYAWTHSKKTISTCLSPTDLVKLPHSSSIRPTGMCMSYIRMSRNRLSRKNLLRKKFVRSGGNSCWEMCIMEDNR